MAWVHTTKDGLMLSNDQGKSQPQTVYGAQPNIPVSNAYTQGKMDGSDSYFVAYSVPNYNARGFTREGMPAIVDSTSNVEFGFTARSVQGFNKEGITVFQDYFFCGKARNYTSTTEDITGTLPGASSVIINKGWWSLYTQKNCSPGSIVTINNGTRFGPGTRISGLQSANDKVQSIQYFETFQ